MRILALTNWYPPHHRGGYELSCLDVTERLRDRGHRVNVLCSDQRMAGVADDPDQGHVQRRLRMYFDQDEPVRPGIREQLGIERHNHDVLAETLGSFEPDVVFVWHMAALSLGLLTAVADRGKPLVYSICDDWLTYGPAMDPWTRRFHGGLLRRAAGAVARRLSGIPTRLPDLGTTGIFCFNSSTVRAGALASTAWTFPRSMVVFSGIDDRVYANVTTRPNPWAGRLLYVGRFDPRKGIETLLGAMRLLPEATLTLCGLASPSERAWVDGLLAQHGLGDRVSVRTSERHHLPALYQAADAVIFPSEWPEPFGLVPVEAMACGTPVVATGTGGSGEYLQDGVNCLLVPPGDERALAAAVQRLAVDGELRERLVAGGHRTSPLLTATALTDAMEACLQAAVGDRPDVPADRVVPDLSPSEPPRASRPES